RSLTPIIGLPPEVIAARASVVVSGTVDVLAADRGEVGIATGTDVSTIHIGQTAIRLGPRLDLTQLQLRAPAPGTNLSVSPRRVLVDGLANGETQQASTARDHSRSMPGDGTAVTAVARLDDGTVVTGSAGGTVRWWPPDPDHGATTGPRHDGPVTGIVAVEPWVLTAGQDGRVVLWDPATAQPVHEVARRAPVVALAAGPGQTGDLPEQAEAPRPARFVESEAPETLDVSPQTTLVAARDAHGRLWTFTLDLPRATFGPLDDFFIEVTDVTLSGPSCSFTIVDAGLRLPYEIVAIRCTQAGQPLRVRNTDPWPAIDPDGRLAVPWQPAADRPLRLLCDLPVAASTAALITLTVDLVSRSLPGYQATIRRIGPQNQTPSLT